MSFLISKNKFFSYKAEGTKGTKESTLAYLLARELKIGRDIETVNTTYENAMGQRSQIVASKKGSASFALEMTKGITATPVQPWTDFLPSCGFVKSSNVFTLGAQDLYGTVTIGKTMGTIFESIYGAAGSVSFELNTNQKGIASFTYNGIYDAQTAVTLPAPAITYLHAPIFQAATVTWGLWTPKVSQIKIEVQNTIELIQVADGAYGFLYAAPTERKVKITMNPLVEAIADKAIVADYLAGTSAPLTISWQGIEFKGDNVQIATPPQDSEREGFNSYELELVANGASGGNGELKITQTVPA